MLQLVELLCSMLQPMELPSMMTSRWAVALRVSALGAARQMCQPRQVCSQMNVLHASACGAAMLRAPVSGALKDDVITEYETISPPPRS